MLGYFVRSQFLTGSEESLYFEAYLEEMRSMEALDFSSMVSEAVRLLEGNATLRTQVASSLQHVLVDEVRLCCRSAIPIETLSVCFLCIVLLQWVGWDSS